MTHAGTGREPHLAFLHVKACVREKIVIAGVIVMHVRGDHVFDRVEFDSDG